MPPFVSTVVGSYPQPDWLVDRAMLKDTVPRVRLRELWRVAEPYLAQAQDDATLLVKQSFGTAGFGIECARVIGEIKNSRFELARNWKLAREAAPACCRVKQTVTGPHVLTRFSVNQRPDLYPDEQALSRAYAKVLAEEIREVHDAGHVRLREFNGARDRKLRGHGGRIPERLPGGNVVSI